MSFNYKFLFNCFVFLLFTQSSKPALLEFYFSDNPEIKYEISIPNLGIKFEIFGPVENLNKEENIIEQLGNAFSSEQLSKILQSGLHPFAHSILIKSFDLALYIENIDLLNQFKVGKVSPKECRDLIYNPQAQNLLKKFILQGKHCTADDENKLLNLFSEINEYWMDLLEASD